MTRSVLLKMLIVGCLLANLQAGAATLPTEEEVAGIQNLCGAGNVRSVTIKGNVDTAITNWRSSSAGVTAEVAKRNLAAALDQVKREADLEPVYKRYLDCVADSLRQFLSTGPGPGSTPETVTALRPTLESNGIIFSFEVHTNYSGKRGPAVAVEVCAEQDPGNMCATSRRPISVGDDDVSRVRMATHGSGFLGLPLDLEHPIDFKACMIILDAPGRESVRFGCRVSQWTPVARESDRSGQPSQKQPSRAVTDEESYQWLRAFFAKYMSGRLPYVHVTDCCFAPYSWRFARLDACHLTYSLEVQTSHSDGKPNTDEVWNFEVNMSKLPPNAAHLEQSPIADGFQEIALSDPTHSAISIQSVPQGKRAPNVGAAFTMNAVREELQSFLIAFEHLRDSCAAAAGR